MRHYKLTKHQNFKEDIMPIDGQTALLLVGGTALLVTMMLVFIYLMVKCLVACFRGGYQ